MARYAMEQLKFPKSDQHQSVPFVPVFGNEYIFTLLREQEITQLRNWQRNVNQLISKFEALDVSAAGDVEEGGQKADKLPEQLKSSTQNRPDEAALEGLRATFHRDFKKQLYSDIDDATFFIRIKKELKHMDRRLEDGAVVLQHLEMFLINVACDDPGRCIYCLQV